MFFFRKNYDPHYSIVTLTRHANHDLCLWYAAAFVLAATLLDSDCRV